MDKNEIISKDLETQWKDHFHMRDQTWKTIQFGILFFIGVVGLDYTIQNKFIIIFAYSALFLTSLSGLLVTIHLRLRQMEKFEIIKAYEKELGIYHLIEPIIEKSKKSKLGRIKTPFFILFIHIFLMLIAASCIIYLLFFSDGSGLFIPNI
ncbi:MAG: hypothetical protein ACFFC3_13350, partial [Candidatus Odinarchaeota archaeon]